MKKNSSPKKSAAKPAVAKKTPARAAEKPAVAAEAKPATVAKSRARSGPATIVVRYDAGWGNTLHLRGEGPGLSWDIGAPLCCVKDSEWVWVAPAAGTVVFKVLHNDNAWSLGENIIAGPGETVTISPSF